MTIPDERSVETDVLVIGAGPGGSAASAWLSRRGWKVLCVEAASFPRWQIGESLLPRCNDLLAEAGLLEAVVARRYQPKLAALFVRGSERERICFADVFPGQATQTFQVPRGDFDQTLATAARRAGVDVRFLHRVDDVQLADDGSSTVTVRDLEADRPLRIRARHLIDCSGFGRVLPRLLSLDAPSVLEERSAYVTQVEGDARPPGELEGDIWIASHPRGGWQWVIPFSDGRTSVGLVAPQAQFDSVAGSDRDKLFTLLAEDPNVGPRLERASPVLKVVRLSGWSKAVKRQWGKGFVLTGNSGEFLDPIFSSGVTIALETSVLAAKLVDRVLKGEPVDFDRDYVPTCERAVAVFRAFVQAWYDGRLQKLIYLKNKNVQVQRALTAILGGYVLDEQNLFVRSKGGAIDALLKML
jgi:flavin-dependent dehydrogenase